MADLPVVRTSDCQKAFTISDLGYVGHMNYVEDLSTSVHFKREKSAKLQNYVWWIRS